MALSTSDRPWLAARSCEVWIKLRRNERPKSMTLTSQSCAVLRTSTLPGLTSRCNTPASWAAFNASAIWTATDSRFPGLNGPCCWTWFSRTEAYLATLAVSSRLTRVTSLPSLL